MMRDLAVLVGIAALIPPSLAAQAGSLQRVQLDALCVTDGQATPLPDGRLVINTPASRAVVMAPTAARAEMRFRYMGASEGSKPLASGQMRRQIGLKLRAQDQCNLLYAMWRIEPKDEIVVSIKRNPGMNTHAACDAHGYTNLRSQTKAPTPPINAGESHTLRAELRGEALTVYADNTIAWSGPAGSDIAGIDGPVGFRTDNARVELEFFAAMLGVQSAGASSRGHCEPAPGGD
jgi:hypothetical protein